jgi:GDP-L-fucose synthase
VIRESTLTGARIYVAGHMGMVGGAIVRALANEGCEVLTTTRREVDLVNQAAVASWFNDNRPDIVVIAAAKVGGILANSSYPAEFIYENLMIASNLVHASHMSDVDRLLFLGSSCIYPKEVEIPIAEASLLTGPLEPTNEWYAIAKIAGIKLAAAYKKQYGRRYMSAMPTNLYGPGDNFDLNSSHVLPALIRKAHEAKIAKLDTLSIWGTGQPLREFMHVDDCADACLFLLKDYDGDSHVNIGSGSDISIANLARLVCDTVGVDARLTFDTTKPDGTYRKLMDTSLLNALGWMPQIPLAAGIADVYQWFLQNQGSLRSVDLGGTSH